MSKGFDKWVLAMLYWHLLLESVQFVIFWANEMFPEIALLWNLSFMEGLVQERSLLEIKI